MELAPRGGFSVAGNRIAHHRIQQRNKKVIDGYLVGMGEIRGTLCISLNEINASVDGSEFNFITSCRRRA